MIPYVTARTILSTVSGSIPSGISMSNMSGWSDRYKDVLQPEVLAHFPTDSDEEDHHIQWEPPLSGDATARHIAVLFPVDVSTKGRDHGVDPPVTGCREIWGFTNHSC
jgi:hypothetical protein